MKALLLAEWRVLRQLMADGALALWAGRRELAAVLVGLAGWYDLTRGFAALFGPVTWSFSFGLLCLSLFGWKLLWALISQGLYALSQRKERTP